MAATAEFWACVETRPNGRQVVHATGTLDQCDRLAGILRACGFAANVRPASVAKTQGGAR